MRMNKLLLGAGLVCFGVAATMAPSPARAANAGDPYGNIDHRNDAGDDTGDSRVDALNANQLNRNYQGPVTPRAPAGPGMTAPAQPETAPLPPGMTPPPQGMTSPPLGGPAR
jgi:hypothetical protein